LDQWQTCLYYRFFVGRRIGDKLASVVAKVISGDAAVLTAYLTDRIEQRVQRWPSAS
jgi:hypothetical protein